MAFALESKTMSADEYKAILEVQTHLETFLLLHPLRKSIIDVLVGLLRKVVQIENISEIALELTKYF